MTTLLRLGTTPALAVRFRRVARVWVGAILLGSAGLGIFRTTVPTAQEWEPMAWSAGVGALLVAAVAMWWSDGVTGAWLGLVGVIAWVGATARYGPGLGVLPVAACLPPAVLLVFAWQHLRTRRALFAFLLGVVLLLTGGGLVALAAYQAVSGPTHPASATPAAPDSPVEWMWSGAVTTEGFTVVAAIDAPGPVALRVWSEGAGEVGTFAGEAVGDPPVARFTTRGLSPATRYGYVVSTPVGDGPAGRVRTFPEGAADVTIAFASCARLGSNGAVFDAIAALDPDLYVITGDWFYADIAADNADAFRAVYRATLTRPAQAALYRSVPIAYVWDDHDFGANDAVAASPSRAAAMRVYRELVPHYPLAGSDSAIFQSFAIGRVRVLIMDTRSARTKTELLGREQSDWLHEQLRAAASHGELVLLVSSVPWITPDAPGADDWGGFPRERQEIAAEVMVSGAQVVLLGGDAHMVAIDDGTNNTFATYTGEPGFVVFHAGALDRPGSLKGGPYSEGAVPGGGHFGVVEIADDGDTMVVSLRGLDWQGRVLVEYSFTVGAG